MKMEGVIIVRIFCQIEFAFGSFCGYYYGNFRHDIIFLFSSHRRDLMNI
jgi:hypothetical protein